MNTRFLGPSVSRLAVGTTPWTPVSAFVLVLSLEAPVFAQTAAQAAPKPAAKAPAAALPPLEGGTPAPAPPREPAASPPTVPAPLDLDTRRERAMHEYLRGEVGPARRMLESLLRECASDLTVCQPRTATLLYRDLGVVLAGGLDEHDKAVQAFQRALVVDSRVELPPRLATPKVRAAFDEAQKSADEEVARRAAPPSTEARPVADAPGSVPNSPTTIPGRRGFILVDAVARYGSFIGWGAYGAGQLAGALTLGVLPGRGKFAVGGRLRGGGYVGAVTEGFAGAAALLGTVWPRPNEPDLAYVFGGFGVDYFPSSSEPVLTSHAIGGLTINGIDCGIGLEFGLSASFASVMFGLNVGYGSLF